MSEQVTAPIQLNRISFTGKIHLIDHDDKISKAAEALSKMTQLGFDTETRPAFKKGEVHQVALLQLSTETDAYIFRLHQITEFKILISILENPDIVKVGVAIRDDLKTLQKKFSFTPQNFIELQTLAKTKGLQNFGLKSMTEEVFQATITKSAKMTNWELPVLSDKQLNYAATDAWIGLMLYQKLIIMTDPVKALAKSLAKSLAK